MKILIATDKFKGSLSAQQVCAAIANGILSIDRNAQVTLHPLADGGDGSLEVLNNHFDLEKIQCATTDPLGREVMAHYLVSSSGEAFIEVAAASGMVLLKPEERNPLKTSSKGTGTLIVDAMSKGVSHINILLGGSATNDGGTGILQALGFDFLDEDGKSILPRGETLYQIHQIVPPGDNQRLSSCSFSLWCDVTNPFFGTRGAAHVFAHQKGANSAMIQQLDDGLKNFSEIIRKTNGKNVSEMPGAGAAGGIAGGLVGLLNADIVSGASQIMQLTRFEEQVAAHDVIITGEGSLDEQSLNGKVVDGVAKLAHRHRKEVSLICGVNQLSTAKLSGLGIKKCLEIMKIAPSQEVAMKQAEQFLQELGAVVLI
ncbi:MAG: glycerate kinase [Bacteroidota bacterium]